MKAQAFIKLCFSQRCNRTATIKSVCEFINEFYDFAMAAEPAISFTGEKAIACLARWFDTPRIRGPTAPRMEDYAQRVFGESSEVDSPINHPAKIDAGAVEKSKPAKQAPPTPLDFIRAIENATVNTESPVLERLFYALTLLQIYAYLRICDTRKVSHLFFPNAAICGVSIGRQSNNQDVAKWAAPLSGIAGIKWWIPTASYWGDQAVRGQTGNFPPCIHGRTRIGKLMSRARGHARIRPIDSNANRTRFRIQTWLTDPLGAKLVRDTRKTALVPARRPRKAPPLGPG